MAPPFVVFASMTLKRPTTYHFAANIWSWFLLVFETSDRSLDSIHNTLENWRLAFSSQPLINLALNLLPSIIC